MRYLHTFSVFLAAGMFLQADVLPPEQDSSSLSGKITTATGKAGTLAVKATRKGYVQFTVGNLPGDIVAGDVAAARLRIYFSNVTVAGDIGIHTVATTWDEKLTQVEPGVSVSPVATIPLATVIEKKFVEVDVTTTVRGWVTTPADNNGFAFVTSGVTNVLIGAKEGAGSGYPCELEIQIDRAIEDGSIASTQLASGAAVANLTDGSVPVAKLASSSLTVTAGSGLSGGGSVSLGGNVTLSLADNITLGGTTSGVFSGTFSGDGSALTGTPGVKHNLQQVALLKWGAKTIDNEISVGSAPFGVCFDGQDIWVTNTGSNNVRRINANTGNFVDEYGTGVGPAGVCFDGKHIWVANQGSASVSRVKRDNTGIDTFSAGTAPYAICFDGTSIWVANISGTTVTKINAVTGAVIDNYTVAAPGAGSGPLGICFDGANIWVTNNNNNTVVKLNANTGAVLGTFAVGSGPYGICFDGSCIWVANYLGNNVTKLNASTGAIIGNYSVSSGPVGPVGICFDGTNIWVANAGDNSVTVLKADTGANIGTYSAGQTPEGICFDGTNIWVVNRDTNNVTRF